MYKECGEGEKAQGEKKEQDVFHVSTLRWRVLKPCQDEGEMYQESIKRLNAHQILIGDNEGELEEVASKQQNEPKDSHFTSR